MLDRHELDATPEQVPNADNQQRPAMMMFAPRPQSQPWRQWLETLRQSARARLLAIVTASVGIGLGAGLTVGWLIWPVEWSNISYRELEPHRQTAVIETLTDLYAYNQNSNAIMRVAGEWPQAAGIACQLAAESGDPIRRIQFIGLAHRLNGEGCD